MTAAGGKVIDALPDDFQRLVGHAPPARRRSRPASKKKRVRGARAKRAGATVEFPA